MGVIADYLRIGRAQTAAVEGAGFPLAAWIGGAPLWTLPLFAILGIVAHLGGFGENGITDLAYDRGDPSKLDHPLVSGRVPFRRGLVFVYACQAAGVAVFVGVLGLAHEHSGVPVLAFVGYILLGHAYNLLGKAWKPGAVLEISGAFALAFLACATAWTGRATDLVWAVATYAFAFTAFQIAVAGELKELGQRNEGNLLRRLGSRVGPGLLGAASPTLATVVDSGASVTGDTEPFLLVGRATWWFGLVLSALKALALAFVASLVSGAVLWPLWSFGTPWGTLIAFVSGFAFAAYSTVLLWPGPFDRGTRLRIMGIGEAGSYLLLVFALAPALWPWLLPAFVVLPVLWFAGMNRWLWARTGSAWAPGV
jgi:4-hydroxybenzoate polyprenyltransferase